MDDVSIARRVQTLDWDELERALRDPASAGLRERDLRAHFGNDFERLRRFAGQAGKTRDAAAAGAGGGPLGNVVVLPGIMGSTLDTVRRGDTDNVWLNFLRLAAGRIGRLKLSADGTQEADREFRVIPSGMERKTYAPLVMRLRSGWTVAECPYDWRRHLDEASDALAALVRSKFPVGSVHLVAHSMGGLVARNFIRRHPDVWKRMAADGRGGRLVMLGTPNYGSFVIPQVLTGTERALRLLERVDAFHNLNELLEITNTFPGSYLMLPAPDRLPPDARAIYAEETWRPFRVSQRHLDAAAAFHAGLAAAPGTIDPDRMCYVAGYGQPTLAGLRVVTAGEFDYAGTLLGDGRVPHALGLLEGVRTYYVEESHGDLPRNESVLNGIDDLLRHGESPVLSAEVRAPRGPVAPAAWRRSVGERELGAAMERVSAVALSVVPRARDGSPPARVPGDAEVPNPREVADAEEVLRAAAAGAREAVREPAPATAAGRGLRPVKPLRLEVEVVRGDARRVRGPVVAVGHYRGVTPVAAEGALDQATNHAISGAIAAGMFGGHLGELFYIPRPAGCALAAGGVLVAGMGEFGTFGRDDLTFLMRNVTLALNKVGHREFATVLIGSGEGNLSKDRAVRGLLEGVCDALRSARGADRHVRRVVIVELAADAATEIHASLRAMRDERAIPELNLAVRPATLPESTRATAGQERATATRLAAAAGAGGPSGPSGTSVRMTIERDVDKFLFSALTEKAVVPVREEPVQSFFVEGAAQRLMESQTRREQELLGHGLYKYLMPEDFQRLIDPDTRLTLIVDRVTAGLPWEMGCFKSATGMHFFGPHLRLARQFRTGLSSVGALVPTQTSGRLRVLVIADPAPEPDLQLPGARREGRAVVRALRDVRTKGDPALRAIEVVDRIGPDACDPVDLLALILAEHFDVIHFAGHGYFNRDDPRRGGWVLGRDRFLSSAEIFKSPKDATRLVFANACFSAVVNPGPASGAEEMNRKLAGVAEAFLERGVGNYLGAGWPVDDQAAVDFAEAFYGSVLEGQFLCDAVAAGREAVMRRGIGSSWGAYQHYGDPATKLYDPRIDTNADGPPSRPRAARKTGRGDAKRLGTAARRTDDRKPKGASNA